MRWRALAGPLAAAGAVSAVLAGLTAGPVAGPAGAEPVAAYGWWSVASTPGGVPVGLPGAPTDGVYLAVGANVPGVTGPAPNPEAPSAAPTAPVAVGAVRFSVPEGATATLSLPVTASSGAEGAGTDLRTSLLACPVTGDPWSPAQNGRWDERPRYDCDAAAAVGTLAGEGEDRRLSWELPPAHQGPGGTVDVALVAFSDLPLFVALDRPGDDAVTVAGGPPGGGGDDGQDDGHGRLRPGDRGGGWPDALPHEAGDQAASAGGVGSAQTAPLPAPGPGLDEAAGGEAAGGPAGPLPGRPGGPAGLAGDRSRALALAGLAGMALAVLAPSVAGGSGPRGRRSGRPGREDASVRGIGRFAAPRTGNVRRLL